MSTPIYLPGPFDGAIKAFVEAQAAAQQNKAEKERLKIEQDRLKFQQQQMQMAQAEAQKKAAEDAASQAQAVRTVLSAFQSGNPILQQAAQPVVQSIANAQYTPQQYGEQAVRSVSPGGKGEPAGELAAAQAKVQAAELDKRLKSVLTPEDYTRYQAATALDAQGLPAEITAKLLPQTARDRADTQKVVLDNKNTEDLQLADTRATAILKRRGQYPASMPDLVPGASEDLRRLAEAEAKMHLNVQEAREKKGIENAPPDAMKYIMGVAEKLVGQQQTQIGPDGTLRVLPTRIGPAEAVKTAVEQARALNLVTPALEKALSSATAQQTVLENAAVTQAQGAVTSMATQGMTTQEIKQKIDTALSTDFSPEARSRIFARLKLPKPTPKKR